MINNQDYLKLKKIFKKGSKTYFNSSFFFSKEQKVKITILYAFVRTVDNLVDTKNQNKKRFNMFVDEFYKIYNNFDKTKKTNKNLISYSFVKLLKEEKINISYVNSFILSMKKDFEVVKYEKFVDLKKYIYGSADVIGLIISRILKISKKGDFYAKKLGYCMQYINFIRDIKEDLTLNRQYIPEEILNKYGLSSLKQSEVIENKKNFEFMIKSEIKRFYSDLKIAKKGFRYIKRRNLVAIKTATDIYSWTAKKIYKSPFVVFERKIKPTKKFVFFIGIKNIFYSYLFLERLLN